MVSGDDPIRATIKRYQETFGAGDREGWLDLFTADAVLEDPVGAAPRQGREELGAFWDETHQLADRSTVRMVQGPAVCGDQAAWAFEAHVEIGEGLTIISIIDVGEFAADGRIRHIRAYWDPSGIRSG